MAKIEEHEIDYLVTRINKASDLIGDVYQEYLETGDIEKVDCELINAAGLLLLVYGRLEKLFPDEVKKLKDRGDI